MNDTNVIPRSLYLIAAGAVLLHMGAAMLPWYELFRDEFYYIACAQRPAFGYVDHPPLSIWVLRVVLETFGDSILAIRFLPSLAAGATAFVAGLLARRFGAGTFGILLGAGIAALVPITNALYSFYSMNAFEPLLWGLAGLLLLRIASDEDSRAWMLLGALIGIGLMNKHTMLLLPAALLPALLLTRHRRRLASRWPWLAAAFALILVLPNLLWQFTHQFPSMEFYANATLYKNIPTSPLEVLIMQVVTANPLFLPFWVLGLWFLFAFDGGRYRLIGWTILITCLLFLFSKSSRPDRIAGIYPLLAAAAGAGTAIFVQRRGSGLRSAVAIFASVAGVAALPLTMPLLPQHLQIETFALLHMNDRQFEKGSSAPLPQFLADRNGWRDMAMNVARACEMLTPSERARAAIGTSNYGEAGALEYYSESLSLPPVLCTHNSYFHWGPGNVGGEVMVMIGTSEEELHEMFEDVQNTWIIHWGGYAMDYENNLPIYICRKPRVPLNILWPKLKKYV